MSLVGWVGEYYVAFGILIPYISNASRSRLNQIKILNCEFVHVCVCVCVLTKMEGRNSHFSYEIGAL